LSDELKTTAVPEIEGTTSPAQTSSTEEPSKCRNGDCPPQDTTTSAVPETTEPSVDSEVDTTTISDRAFSTDSETESVPTETPSTKQDELTTIHSIIQPTTQQTINVTTVKKIESTEEVTFITTIKPDIDTTTTTSLDGEEKTTESTVDSSESSTESAEEDTITSTIKSITDFISTFSPITTLSTTTTPGVDENEIIPDETDVPEDPSHTLKCTPSTSMAPTANGTPFDCIDEAVKEDTTPFIVIIRISNDDLNSVLTKKVKIVVKDFMLMEMPMTQPNRESLSPK
jgi:hypothetical protein